jgi:hypothetical protein
MKTVVMSVVLVFCGIARGQTSTNPEAVIQRMIDSGSLEGHDQKVIGPLGDAAAVALTKVLAGRTLTTEQIDSALLILNMAFGDPNAIEIAADRKPRAALFILQSFDHWTQDAALRRRISETREYIQARYSQTTNDSSNNVRK